MGLFMCRIASLFLLQTLKGSMSGDARDSNNMETRAVIIIFPARQVANGNSRHSDRNLRTCIIVCHRQNLGGPAVMRLVLDDPKTITTPEIIDQIHELNLEDRRTSAKLMAEQLDISRERLNRTDQE